MQTENGEKIPKFVADATLGKLAKWLRILGYDTLFCRNPDIDSLTKLAEKENRIILTRNTGFLKKRTLPCQFVRNTEPLEQLRETADAFHLGKNRMFSLCAVCNEKLVPAKKEDVQNRVPEFVYLNIDSYHICPGCKRVFWAGTHTKEMKKRILSALDDI